MEGHFSVGSSLHSASGFNIYFLKKHMGDTVLVYSVPPLYMVTTKFVVLLLFSGVLGELLIIEMDDS